MSTTVEPAAGQTSKPKKMGRPSIYNAELAAEFCDYLAQGMSMRTACAKKGMPSMKTVFLWLSSSNKELWRDDFLQQYTRAKQESADMLAEQILDIADKPVKGKVIIEKGVDKDGKPIIETRIEDMLGHRRLQIDTRKFLMAKMKPKVYGDKMDLTSDGEKLEIGRGMSIEEINLILIRAEEEKRTEQPSNIIDLIPSGE